MKVLLSFSYPQTSWYHNSSGDRMMNTLMAKTQEIFLLIYGNFISNKILIFSTNLLIMESAKFSFMESLSNWTRQHSKKSPLSILWKKEIESDLRFLMFTNPN